MTFIEMAKERARRKSEQANREFQIQWANIALDRYPNFNSKPTAEQLAQNFNWDIYLDGDVRDTVIEYLNTLYEESQERDELKRNERMIQNLAGEYGSTRLAREFLETRQRSRVTTNLRREFLEYSRANRSRLSRSEIRGLRIMEGM